MHPITPTNVVTRNSKKVDYVTARCRPEGAIEQSHIRLNNAAKIALARKLYWSVCAKMEVFSEAVYVITDRVSVLKKQTVTV